MKVIVTGASGFIGTHLVRELKAQGHKVTALCQLGTSATHLSEQGVTPVMADVTDLASLLEPCGGQDWVFHLAAIVSGYGPWERFVEVGVKGTQNVIDAAEKAGVHRFVHLSSMTVYGTRQNGVRLTEAMPLDENPERWNYYVRQKILSEKLVWESHQAGKIRATVFRPSLVIGPGDRNVVGRTLKFVKSPFGAIVGDGRNRMACVVVDELVRTIVQSATLENATGKAYNLSGRNPITQSEYVNLHAEAAGLEPLKRKIPAPVAMMGCAALEHIYRLTRRKNEPFCTRIALALASNDFVMDCSLAAQDLGWQGTADYKEAIRHSVEWYIKHSNYSN
jgi:nucleoside-diphosphate-sugar epimerase